MRNKKNKKIFGMSFVEMIMAIAIFLIGIEGFTLLFIKVWKNNSYSIELGQSSMSASQGLNKMVDYIRRARQGDDGSYPVVSGTNNDLIIFCDYDKDGNTERLHLYRSGANILMGITSPTQTIPKTYPAGDQSVFTVVTHIVNDPGEAIFEYFNKDYPLDTTNNPLSVPIQVSDARLLKIYLEINVDPNRDPDSVRMQSFVEMRNLNDYNQIQ